MSDDFAVVRQTLKSSMVGSKPDTLAALDRIEARLADAERERDKAIKERGYVSDLIAERDRLRLRDKMREDGERHLLSEIEARDAEIKALRKELVLFRREVAS